MRICDCCYVPSLVVERVISLDVSSSVPAEYLCPVCARLVRAERSYRVAVNPFAIERLRVELQVRRSAA